MIVPDDGISQLFHNAAAAGGWTPRLDSDLFTYNKRISDYSSGSKLLNRKIFGSVITCFAVSSSMGNAQELLIFGGSGHDIFLGCFNCSEFSSDSICNEFGAGSSYKSNGIFNEFGQFGSEFSSASPWNEFSSSNDVPVLVDRQGGFYGYFTINEFRSDAVDFAGNLADMHEIADGDLELVQKLLCNALGG